MGDYFGNDFFAADYFGDRYFGPETAVVPPTPGGSTPGSGTSRLSPAGHVWDEEEMLADLIVLLES